ncbi:IST1 homolog isoform X3 [Pelobates cultripes]|uniref:IST1 homolog n=1 Tax=Pelobates cultripes TaxID=61616 RepID=A0AAD1WQ88_PELCU|nr:IST1 homolog isoform X3 [Pelobates cultripes]
MLGSGFKAERLRVNLRLVINRLKLLEKKKTELAQKARKEIADYLSSGKDERARIRVEHIIREDYLVEAMEILELYCDLLLARYGLIQSMKELDPGLAEAVSTLIWAAPRLQTEVSELKIVADQLCAKYSKEYGKLCRTNQIGTVNDRLMHKLSVEAPPKILVERYLIEIAKNYNVPYEPDSVVMEKFNGPPGGMFQPFGNMNPPPMGGLPPEIPSLPPTYDSIESGPTAAPQTGPANNGVPVAKPRTKMPDTFVLPELPSVPDTLPASSAGVGNSSSEDIDFDDLSRRFEELKKKT